MNDKLFDHEDIPDELRDCFDVVETVCGAGWVREVDTEYEKLTGSVGSVGDSARGMMAKNGSPASGFVGMPRMAKHVTTTGWRPACSHDAAPVPCVVLDPFSGSGTTGVVANALGRSYIGLDLNREYIGLAQRRIARPHAPIVRPGKEEYHPLFGDSA